MKLCWKEGSDKITPGIFYAVVVQAVYLFGPVTWVGTLWLDKYLDSFHHWAVRRMVGMGPKNQRYRTWVYPPIEAVLATVGLDEIRGYITRKT